MPKIFTDKQVADFIEDGFLVLENAFDRDVALQCQDFLWSQIDQKKDDPSTWTEHMFRLKENYNQAPFDKIPNQRIDDAYADLAGEGRFISPKDFGWWIVLFPGYYKPPWKDLGGWHVDGSQFHHHLNSKDQGLLNLYMFSDVKPGGGGTAVWPGSHRATARMLREAEPQGLTPIEVCGPHPESEDKVVEAIGNAGDLVICHPFLRHSSSQNCTDTVRFACNPCVVLKEPMNFDGKNPSAVELAIIDGLNRED
jgi:hypothetical protein